MIVTSYGSRRFRAIIVGVFAVATLVTSADPALAKHHSRKPTQLWNKYPLNVQPSKTPAATPSEQPSPTSPASVPTVSSHLTRDVRPRTASTGDGMLLAAVVVVLLALAGILIAALRRRRQPSLQRGNSLHLPAMPWNQPSLRRQRGRSRPRNRRSTTDDSLRAVPPEGGTYLAPVEPDTDVGNTPLGGFGSARDEDDANVERFPSTSDQDGFQTSVDEADNATGFQTSVDEADNATGFQTSVDEEAGNATVFPRATDEDDRAGESEPSPDKGTDTDSSSEAADGEERKAFADDQGEESEADPDLDAEPAAAPTLLGEREHVIVQLADGRSLEGWKRVAGSTNESLLILDVITAFDSEGNHAPTTRADSFILRSEIISIARIDDS